MLCKCRSPACSVLADDTPKPAPAWLKKPAQHCDTKLLRLGLFELKRNRPYQTRSVPENSGQRQHYVCADIYRRPLEIVCGPQSNVLCSMYSSKHPVEPVDPLGEPELPSPAQPLIGPHWPF